MGINQSGRGGEATERETKKEEETKTERRRQRRKKEKEKKKKKKKKKKKEGEEEEGMLASTSSSRTGGRNDGRIEEIRRKFGEETADEIEALLAIFAAEIELNPKGHDDEGIQGSLQQRFRIRVTPNKTDDSTEVFVEVWLVITLPLGYPNAAAASVEVVRIKGLADEEVEELNVLLAKESKDMAKSGDVVTFRLHEVAAEFLSNRNKRPMSFFEERQERIRAKEEEQKLAKERLEKERTAREERERKKRIQEEKKERARKKEAAEWRQKREKEKLKLRQEQSKAMALSRASKQKDSSSLNSAELSNVSLPLLEILCSARLRT